MRLVVLIGLLHMSLAHSRHELLLAIVGPMLLARPVAEALGAVASSEGRVQAEPAPHPNPLPQAGRGSPHLRSIDRSRARRPRPGLSPLWWRYRSCACSCPAPASPPFASTQAALAALPADLKSKPVLNGYAFGGYLIFEGVKPYVDGRADLFGDAFLADYARLARGEREPLEAVLSQQHIAWTMFAPRTRRGRGDGRGTRLAARLRRSPGCGARARGLR